MKLLEGIDKLRSARVNGRKTPHKPLLILYALAEQARNPDVVAKFEFSRIEKDIQVLLNRFYKPPEGNKKHDVNEPFWRLYKERMDDGIWTIDRKGEIRETSSGDAFVGDLRKHKATGMFSEDVVREIKDNPDLVSCASRKLLEEYFPQSMHHDIVWHVGLDPETVSAEKCTAERLKQDSRFRKKILRAYDYSCAMCGFGLRMKILSAEPETVGLEAAHIKWHISGGLDKENNGLALCATHHKLLDYGVLTLSENYRIILSESVLDPDPESGFIKTHQKKQIRLPRNRKHLPDEDYINWHREAVFRKPELVV